MPGPPTPEPIVVLASTSPRRAALLRRLGIEPIVRPSDIDESPLPGERAEGLVARLARTKAEAVEREATDLVIAADTVVVLDDEVLGKPAHVRDAARMLRQLSGRTHRVLTGVHAIRGDREAHAVDETEVRFRQLSDREIESYVHSGKPSDKAGAYGIQDAGGMFVESITGSDTNVVGLPLAAVVRLAADVGAELLPR